MYLAQRGDTELQLKGAGRTPYSRTADGRKVLRSSIREHLASIYMDRLGCPTTKSPSLVVSEDTIARDKYYTGDVVREKCAVVSRTARTFFRFGSFEICKPSDEKTGRAGPSCNDDDRDTGKKLFEFVAKEYFDFPPDASSAIPFLKRVSELTAETVSHWQTLGFTHGVLNTDNMSILGLTIDYGPYGFQEYYDPSHVPNGSDGTGRYAFNKQPEICGWNLMKLAEALHYCGVLPDLDAGKRIVEDTYMPAFESEYREKMRGKLGLTDEGDGDDTLFSTLFTTMAETHADFTGTFLALETFASHPSDLNGALDALVGVCASPQAVVSLMERKMKITRPGMDPRQLMALWNLAQNDPEQLGRHFNAPAEAIVAELRGEMDKLEKYAEIARTREEMEGAEAQDKSDADRVRWREFLSLYKKRCPTPDVQQMKVRNPRFALKNWILQECIDSAESGDYGPVRSLVESADAILDPSAAVGLGMLKIRQTEAPEEANSLYNT